MDNKARLLLYVWGYQARHPKGHTKGTAQQAPGKETGVMADDANRASGTGAGSRGCPIRIDAGEGAAGGSGSNSRCSKRQREQEEDQEMAGEDPGMHMACMMYIASCVDVWGVVLLQPWDPVTVASGKRRLTGKLL